MPLHEGTLLSLWHNWTHAANIRKSQTTKQVTEAGENVTMDADSEESDGEYDF